MPAKILIVDDEVIVAESMRVVLRQLGYEVTDAVNSAEAALVSLAKERPDLVIMDINLGQDQDGIAAAENIRRHHALPVVFVTAYADDATLDGAKISHPFGYVIKPFEARDLRVAIEIALHNHTLEQRLKKSEAALAEKTETYRALLNATLNGILETDEGDHITDANQAYCRLLGYTRAELTVMRIHDLEANLTPSEVEQNTRRMIAAGNAHFETQHRAKDGRLVDLDISITHIPSRSRFVAFCRDITKRKQTESEIRRIGDFNRGILDSLSSHLCVLDESGRILAVNRVWSEFAEDNPPLIANVGVGADYLAVCAATTGADRADAQAMVQGIGSVVRGELAEFRLEYTCHSPDQQRWFMARVTRFFEAGQIRVVISHINITERKQWELALGESEERYRSLFESSRDAITTLEPPSWKFTSGNPAALEIYRARSLEEFVALGPWEFSPERQPDGSESVMKSMEMIETAMRNGSHAFEWTHRRIGGEEFPATVLLSRIQSAGKTFLQATVRDVTEQKRVEARLQSEQTLFNSLISTIPDNIYFKDRQSRFVRINDRMADAFGLHCPGDAVGRSDFDFFTAEHARQAYDDEQRIMSTGEALVGIEEKETWPDGRVTWVSSTKVPLKDADGRVTGLVGISRDVTGRKRNEEALRTSESLLARAMDMAHLAHWEYDAATATFKFNDRFYALYGTTVEREGGYRMLADVYEREFLPPDERHIVPDEITRALAGATEEWQVEHRIKRRDGQFRHIVVRMAVIKDAAGRVLGHRGVNQDITDLRRVEEELRRTSRWLLATQRISAVGGWALNLKTGVVWASPEARRIYGLDDRELTIPLIQSFPRPQFRPVLARALKDLVERGQAYDLDIQIVRGTDSSIVDLHTSAQYNAAESTVLGVVQDITERKRADKALRESEEKFSKVFQNAPAWITITDLHNGHYVDVNHQVLMDTGYSRDEIIGHTAVGIGWISAEDRASVLQELEDRGRVRGREMEYRMKDGRVLLGWIHCEQVVIGNRPCLLTVAINISERKRAEAALRASEEKFAKVFRDAPVWISISDLSDGTYIDVNEEAFRRSGYAREEVIGRKANEVPWLTARARVRLVREIKRRGRVADLEVTYRTKDGGVLHGLLNGELTTIGGRPCLLTVSTDITEHKKIEESLHESEEKFATAFRNSPVAMGIRDLEQDRYIEVNNQCLAMMGYRRDEVIGRTPDEVGWMSEADREENRRTMGATGGVAVRQVRMRHKDGHPVIIDYSSHQIRIGGRPCILSTSIDITARKQAEATREMLARALDRKNRELENLVYVTSHDLRSPMVNIQGFSRRIEAGCQDLARFAAAETLSPADRAAFTAILTEQMPRSLDFIRTSVDKMDRLIHGLLRLSRLGRAGLRPEPLDLNAMLREISGAMAFAIEAAGAWVEIEELPSCRGDAGQVNQLFTNLLDNALKYRDPIRPLRVTVKGRVDAGRAVYCIADTGIGISPEHLNRIWEVFFRAHPDGPATGEGLGLNLAHRIVERHQGEIWVESKLGEGSRFYVALPVAGGVGPSEPVTSDQVTK